MRKAADSRCLNAGVAGYSSHQGVLRFLQEVDRYQARPRPGLVRLERRGRGHRPAGQDVQDSAVAGGRGQRALVRYRAYLVLMYYTQKWRAEPPAATPGPVSPRVSVRRLPRQHGPIPNRGRQQGHRDRIS